MLKIKWSLYEVVDRVAARDEITEVGTNVIDNDFPELRSVTN